MLVKDIMSRPVTVSADTPMQHVADAMVRKGVRSVVVVDEDGTARGIITERDFVEQVELPYSELGNPTILRIPLTSRDAAEAYSDARHQPARKIMRPLDGPLAESDPIEKALDLLQHRGKRHLVVVRWGRPVGIVGHHEFMVLAANGTRRNTELESAL